MNLDGDDRPMQAWKGIAESIVPVTGACLDYSSALQSPCESCPTSPCCSYLPLGGFRAATLSDLDYAKYLLNFERIELGLSSSGDWSIFYRYPCRYLDRSNFACTVHEKPEQPHICRRYNPYRCWYKAALTKSSTADYLRVDRSRFEFLLTGIGFDAQGNIVESPDWPGLLQSLETICDPPANDAQEPEPAVDGSGTKEKSQEYSFEQLQQPCAGCSAYCCKVLIFPMERPADISGLDYVQFCLGFPGIRLSISDTQWAILVDTECRHLKQNRCSVFGLPERPLACRYYDEWRCSYKFQFERPESAGVLRVGLEQYRQLLASIEFDANGAVQRIPAVEDLRRLVNGADHEGQAKVGLDTASDEAAETK
jgi:hypothetical protein